jgi:hypothetical protein
MAIITLNNNSLSSVTALPAGVGGKVLQVVNSDNSYAATTTNTKIDVLSSSGVSWEPTITPSSTSSKIIITANLNIRSSAYQIAEVRSYIDILYKIGSGSYSSLNSNSLYSIYDYGDSGVSFRYNQAFQYLISPSTTSGITVKFTIKSVGSGTTTDVNDGGNSSCILYEVAG